jgi:taurine dioxygenase
MAQNGDVARIDVVPLAGALGAEIRGVDLRALDDPTFAAVHRALLDYEVVFFRGVGLSEEEHLELGRWFGTPSTFEIFRVMGETEPTLTTIADGPDSPPGADDWHTDVTWIPEPPDYAILQGNVIPARGGDTMWASTTAAYDALSPVMQEIVCGLEVVHHNESFIAGVRDKAPAGTIDDVLDELAERYPPVTHPLVRTHPETGRRALFLGGRFMQAIVGMHPAESDTLLALLKAGLDSPRIQVRWKWEPGDVAIWDERSTNHRAVADHYPQIREVRRCEIEGGRPFFDPDAVASPRRPVASAGPGRR